MSSPAIATTADGHLQILMQTQEDAQAAEDGAAGMNPPWDTGDVSKEAPPPPPSSGTKEPNKYIPFFLPEVQVWLQLQLWASTSGPSLKGSLAGGGEAEWAAR